MSANQDLERRIADFYATEAPTRAPDWVLESALATIDTTEQWRALIRVPRRFQNMSSFAKLAVAAVSVIALGAVALAVLQPGDGRAVGGGTATAVPSASSVPTRGPSPAVSPALTETYTSASHGISISYPSGWTVRQATEPWTTGVPFQASPFADVMESVMESGNTFILVTSQPLAGKTADRWAADVSNHADWGDTCAPSTEPVTIDGTAGLLVIRCPDSDVQSAVVWIGDRGYLIVGYQLPSVEYFKAVLATVRLHPEDALDSAPSPSP